ncbi:MAG: cellulase family glycosylhydrolase [Draconibacterium sp.]
MNKIKINIAQLFPILLSSIIVLGCSKNKHEKESIFPVNITVNGDHFVDDNGRHVILNGINIECKSKEDQYLVKDSPEFYVKLKSWGYNCIRFIIIWDGLEPEPGVYNEDYLKEIDKRIQWAGENNMFVVLDMHQDLFSVKYGDGAPEWATLEENEEHIAGEIWSDAYFMSNAVQTAFDNFWGNKPASDGVGIQDHYANLWKYIADRYADNPTVIGYDIFNEPFAGSSAKYAMPAILKAYGELVYEKSGKLLTEEELVAMWSDGSKRAEALNILTTRDNYSQVIDALYELNREFETTYLQAMYQKVANSIREVDSNHILFLEHSYFSNMGVNSSIERVTLEDGSPDVRVAYAPHGYDLVTDTEDASSANSERIQLIFDRIKAKGEQLKMPVWLGEWGAYYGHSEGMIPVAQNAVSLIESNLFGSAYWSFYSGIENMNYFQKALLRPYPAYISGELIEYSYDQIKGELNVEWAEESCLNPSIIFVPWLSRLKTTGIDNQIKIEKISNSDSGWVIVNPSGKGDKRRIVFRFE